MKFALCNEVLQHLSIEDGFFKIAEIGYDGVEIAPFTLKENPLDVNEEDAERCIKAAESAGIEIIGLHWLMAKTEGLHLTHQDEGMRNAACEYLKKLTTLTAQMGGKIMVLGSPQQRNLRPGTPSVAFERAVTVIREVCELAETGSNSRCRSLLLVETNFLGSCQEARRFIAAVNRPSCRLHLDIKAMAHETAGPVATIYEHRWEVEHFHGNDVNLGTPSRDKH